MSIARWGIVALLAWPAGMAGAQQQSAAQTAAQSDQKQDQKQQDPLAEASRRAREQKKQQSKAARTWDNDNIPTTPDAISIVGESSSTGETPEKTTSEKTASQSGAAASSEKSVASKNSTEGGTVEQRKAALTKQLAQAKERLQSLTTDLDILSRKYTLDQQTYYGKPDYSSDTEGAVKLKVEESQITSKKQEVADAQKKVDDLTAQLKEIEAEPTKPASNPL
jgi:hypothetical protein